MTESTPLACNLSDPERAKRLVALEAELFAGALETAELEAGYAFVFPGDAAWLAKLTTFIAEERDCCPFLRFELTVEPNAGPIALRLSGPEGAKAVIERQFLPAQVAG
jgi:hypothetical protein